MSALSIGILNYYRSTDKELSKYIKNIFGYYPENIFLYKLAFKHKSVAEELKNGIKNSNERLEFLGDTILDSIVTDYLFRVYPFKDEGFLTKLRSKIVSRSNLNKLAGDLGIERYIDIDSDINKQSITVHGNALEALVGAMYLDKGYKFIYKVFVKKVFNKYIDVNELQKLEVNFKSKLIEWGQKNKKEIEFRTINETGKGNNITHEVNLYVEGEYSAGAKGGSIKRAEQKASKKACEKLHLIKKEGH